MVRAAAGAADLLVVRHRRARGAQVHHEGQVRLVEPHTQGRGGHHRLDPVGLEVLLDPLPLLRVRPARVGHHVNAGVPKRPGGVLRRGDGERVDDPRARQLREVLQQPRQPRRGAGQAQHPQAQRRARQRTAQHEHLLPGLDVQLFHDVLHHTAVGGGGGGQHRHGARAGGGQLPDQVPDPPVVRPEVVPPVGDAVRLVHHQQAHAGDEVRELLVPEAGVGQALGRDQQHVHLVRGQGAAHVLPFRGVGRAHGHGPHAGPGGRGHLVPHQGQQRGDDQRGPGAPGPQQQGGHEVHRGLAPAGALDHERAAPVGHERLHCLVLALLELGVRAAYEVPQDRQRLGVQRRVLDGGRGARGGVDLGGAHGGQSASGGGHGTGSGRP